MKSSFEEKLKEILRPVENKPNGEPLPGHEERFEMRLLKNVEQKKSKVFQMWTYSALAAAAIIAVVFTVVLKSDEKISPQENMAVTKLSDVSYEMSQIEKFYTEKLAARTVNYASPDIQVKRFQEETSRLEGEYKVLERILSKNPSNEKIINAMIGNYRFKLQILESLQKYTEIQNKKNNPTDEKKINL